MKTNKLIAEFMGIKTITIDELKSTLKQNREDGFIHTPQAHVVDDLKYHTSWDWLMPVVQRIECTSTDNKDNSDNFFNVTIEVFECNINGVDTSINISHNAQTKIKATYNAVVEFIKEYNKQN